MIHAVSKRVICTRLGHKGRHQDISRASPPPSTAYYQLPTSYSPLLPRVFPRTFHPAPLTPGPELPIHLRLALYLLWGRGLDPLVRHLRV